MNVKAVLFDLDGVLIDSEGVYTEFWTDIDRRFPTGVPGFAQAIKGSTLPVILNSYFPDADVQTRVRELLVAQERDMVYRPFAGALELMRLLSSRGIAKAIVTSSNFPKMRHLFDSIPDFEELADALVTDEDVTRSKPDPEGYLTAAKRLGREPGECAVVEDSLAGLRAGRAAGAFVVGLTTTNPREAIEPLADITFADIGELLAHFDD